jgi:hypothetical protein
VTGVQTCALPIWTESEWGGDVLEEYQRPYTEDRIMVEFITHIDFEEGKQLTIVC